MKNSLLEISKIKLSLPNSELLLEGGHFEAKKYEVTALVGENGCGKSSFIRSIIGLFSNLAGDYKIKGNDLLLMSSIEKSELISLLPQHIETSSFILTRDYLQLCGEYDKELCSRLKIESLLTKKMDMLSGGELKRVALCGILLRRPQLMLLDEPFQNLDPQMKEVFQKEMRNFCKNGGAIIMSSHDFWWSISIIDSIYGIKEKKLMKGECTKEFIGSIMAHPFNDSLMPMKGDDS